MTSNNHESKETDPISFQQNYNYYYNYYTYLLQNARYLCAQQATHLSENVANIILSLLQISKTTTVDADGEKNIRLYITKLNKSMSHLWEVLNQFMMNKDVYDTFPSLTYVEMHNTSSGDDASHSGEQDDSKTDAHKQLYDSFVREMRLFMSPVGTLFACMDFLKVCIVKKTGILEKEIDLFNKDDRNWHWWCIPSLSNVYDFYNELFTYKCLINLAKSQKINLAKKSQTYKDKTLVFQILFFYMNIPYIIYRAWRWESIPTIDNEYLTCTSATSTFLTHFLNIKIKIKDSQGLQEREIDSTVEEELSSLITGKINVDQVKSIIDRFVEHLWNKIHNNHNSIIYSNDTNNLDYLEKIFCEIIVRFHDFASDTACLLAILGNVLTANQEKCKGDIKEILGLERIDNDNHEGQHKYNGSGKLDRVIV